MRHDINLKLKVLMIIGQWKSMGKQKNPAAGFTRKETGGTNIFIFSMWEWGHRNNAASQNSEQTVHKNEEVEPI